MKECILTLLTGAMCNDGVVVTADGRCNERNLAGHSVNNDALQKIFFHENLPLAIARHGENRFDKVPVSQLIRDFLHTLKNGDPQDVWKRLKQRLGPIVEKGFRENPWAEFCGFWVIGMDKYGFRIYEAEWDKKTGSLSPRKGRMDDPLLLAGDCWHLVGEYRTKPIDEELKAKLLSKKPIDYGIRFSDRLYELTMQQRPAKCGGRKHQLKIKRRWLSLDYSTGGMNLMKMERRRSPVRCQRVIITVTTKDRRSHLWDDSAMLHHEHKQVAI